MVRSKSHYILFIMVCFGVGCAAQNARSNQKRAEMLLKQAQAEKPDSSKTKEAESKMASAKRLISSARYDRAEQALKESIEASEAALGVTAEVPAVKESETAVPVVTEPVQPTTAMVAPKPEIQKVEPQKIEEPNSKRGMPAKALAKYLASKHALTAKAPAPKAAPPVEVSKTAPVPIKTSAPSPVAEAPAKVEAPTKTEVPTKAEVPAPIPAPVAKAPVAEPQTPVAPKVAERSKDSKIPGGDDSKAGLAVEESGMSEKAEKETPVVTKIVEAPSAKMNKKAPEKKPSLSEDEKIIEAPKEAQTAKPQKSLAKRKIPGSIEFKMNDPSIQGDAMTNLDQTGKFLLENPSTTLILQGVSSSGEISNIIDSRYESIRSYLTAKGVPDDQIRLDPERKNGKAPQFELYLIEH